MKKFAPVLVIVGVLILGFLYFMNVKNKALLFSQATEKEWGNVNTAYQRRLDLIDNLVNTVKGAADFEKSTLTAVIEARRVEAEASSSAVNSGARRTTSSSFLLGIRQRIQRLTVLTLMSVILAECERV